MPSKRKSSACVDYVPALCTHRPSLLPIEWLSEAFGLAQGGRRRPPRAGKFVKLGHLEEVKVVTRFPLVNQRKDHYRATRPGCAGAPERPRPRASLPPHVNLNRVASAVAWPPFPPRCGGGRARRRAPNISTASNMAVRVGGMKINCEWIAKTFNNGSLGSGIDEERSEMR